MSKKTMNDILQVLAVTGIGWAVLAIVASVATDRNTDLACLIGLGVLAAIAFLVMMYRQTNPDPEADERDEEQRKLAQLQKYKKKRKR